MVHEQGEVIDSIESNIESTAVHVTTGTEELRQVRSSQFMYQFNMIKTFS